MSRLWYQAPAAEWEEALPIGNGRLGAMVYGGTDRELIQVNEESMWYGGRVDRLNPDAKENLPRIRELLKEGRISQAERLMETALSGCPDSMHAYQTLGEIQFYFDHIPNARERKSGKVGTMALCQGMTEYERSLSLDTAVTECSFRSGNTLYRREYFASHPADCILMRFAAQGEGTVDFLARLRRGKCFDGVKKLGNDGILLYGNLGRGGYEFAMALRAKAEGGTVRTVGECLQVEGAKEVTLMFTADTTYHYGGEERDAYVEACLSRCADNDMTLMSEMNGKLSRLEQEEYGYQEALRAFLTEKIEARFEKIKDMSYAALREEHIRDHRAFYDRFAFDLRGAGEYDNQPTDVRLQQVQQGKTDAGLMKLLFDYGRYLTIACSREGGLPSTLQGLWNREFFPPWDSKYTININTEMNYWHVESCNLSECHLPLFRLLEKVRINGRRTAREMYGCRGFVAHHNTDIHGDTAPQDIWYPGTYWTLGGAWLSTHLWRHYQYTRDREFLRRAFPVMAEAALFFVDFLTEEGGYLVTNPSVSPENSYRLPNGEAGACCVGATMDNQILRDLFQGCADAWKALGEEAPAHCDIEGMEDMAGLMERIAECGSRLMPTRISPKTGAIMEWMEDYEEVDPGHRHISHLYGLYPGEQITVDGTPELAQAAKKTLERRLANGGGHTGWSRAWITNHYASLWNGEKACESIMRMLERSTYPNLFDRHPPFQIDGNFGICAAMCRMLAQSSEERVVLLPALPAQWESGAVRGLRLVGNAGLSMTWERGRITAAEITADSDYHTAVVYQGQTREITLKAGERLKLW
ncbi:MAG: glycoside hydrolase family 95 protein [Blautia sp.]|nr:glycoside hydrolase family 95 protein [Blautia sp.]